jgi:tRNA pseudouridine13 synthase
MKDASRFLTAELRGVGGDLRDRPEDFRVEELPRRAPSGRGEFARALIEKRGISTPELQRRLGAALGVPATAIGVAGMKDADAVTRQWISAPWAKEPKLSAAKIRDVEVLEIARDDAPLHLGELAGNRFTVHVRGVGEERAALASARAILDVLARRGVPNFFGAQRFGTRGEAAELGRLLLLGQPVAALDLLLGAPSTTETDPRARAFREAYERRAYREARSLVPGRLSGEARLLDLLARGKPKEFVARQLAPATRRFALSAWQSLQFNRLLAWRLPRIDVALEGDLLLRDGEATARRCVEPAADQPEVARLVLHPTAPLFGARVELASGEAGVQEQRILAESGVPRERLERPTGLALFGERREVRFAPADLDVRALPGEGTLVLTFQLPPGCFATTLLGEITKSFLPPI